MCPSTPPWRKKSWPAWQRAARAAATTGPARGPCRPLPEESVPASQDALDGTSSALKKGGFVLTLRDGTAIDLMECDTDF